jgi:hypothetical protein
VVEDCERLCLPYNLKELAAEFVLVHSNDDLTLS